MNKSGLLNPHLARVIAEIGHTDLLVVADAGLPVPPGVERIDLAVVAGVPSFDAVLAAILESLVVEGAVLAEEFVTRSAAAHARTVARLGVTPSYVPHEEFKRLTRSARAVVRTGECTPYSNVVLRGGVNF